MRTYTFTNGKKEMKSYEEISNIAQGVYSKNEMMRRLRTDQLQENENYDTRFEEIK